MLSSRSDAQLVCRALADHSDAFETLVFRYQKKAFAVARALGVSTTHVDDVVQDAFLKAFENLPRLRSRERFGLWFLNIVRNGARRSLRNKKTGGELSLIDLGGQPGTLSPEHSELKREVSRSVSELPETLRETIFLYYYEGESVKEVARALQVSKGAVLKRLERGRGLLRDKLWRTMEDAIRDIGRPGGARAGMALELSPRGQRARKTRSPVSPFPEPGEDPTEDDMSCSVRGR